MKNDVKKARYLYEDYYLRGKKTIEALLKYYKEHNQKVAIWGGGLKGVAFLNTFDRNPKMINNVFDNNEKKWGTEMPTGHPINGLNSQLYQDVEIILLMNNNYESEVAEQLISNQKRVFLVNIDSIIWGELTWQESLKLYGRRVME